MEVDVKSNKQTASNLSAPPFSSRLAPATGFSPETGCAVHGSEKHMKTTLKEESAAVIRMLLSFKSLTEKQMSAFTRCADKLPDGYSYALRDDNDNHETVRVWGVELYRGEAQVGYVGKSMTAHYTPGASENTQKQLLNRVSVAIWHKQPAW